MFNKIKNYISDICFDFLNNTSSEGNAVVSTLKSKIAILLSTLVGLFILTKFYQSLLFIILISLMLYVAFEFIRVNNNKIIDKNKIMLLYFYILLPFIFIFKIKDKIGFNFLFWFLSYIVCLKFINCYLKNLFEKEQSKILLLLFTSVFSIFYGFIFSFILKIGLVKFVAINLLILVLNQYENIWLNSFKNELNINNIDTPILSNIDGFILSGLLINILNTCCIL